MHGCVQVGISLNIYIVLKYSNKETNVCMCYIYIYIYIYNHGDIYENRDRLTDKAWQTHMHIKTNIDKFR